jgi:hypothetical protein
VQNIGRAMNPMQGHGGKWHYYIVVFAISVLPWLLWMPSIVKHWQRTNHETSHHLIRFTLLWMVVVFILFSIAQTKLPHYISSLYPAVALAIAAVWFQHKPSNITILQLATTAILLPLAAALIIFPFIYPELIHWVHHPRAIAILSQDIQPSIWISIAGIILLFACFLLWQRKSPQYALQRFVMIGFILQSVLIISLGNFAGALAQAPQTRIAERIKHLPSNMTIYSYNLNFPSISFQSKRSYHIILNHDGQRELQNQQGAYAVILRAESLPDLPWLQSLTPTIKQGGFMLYVVTP